MIVLTVKPPTYMRYARVEQVLSQELAFRDRLSPKSEAVLKPDGESQLFSSEIIAITQLIHNDGKDAHKCQKLDVIRAAVDFFRTPQAAPPAPPAPPKVEVPAEPATPPPSPKKIPAPKAEKPTPAPKPVPKQKAKAQPVQAAVMPPPVQEAQKSESTSETTSDVKREDVIKAAKEVLLEGTSEATINPYISMYTLVITALQNCELFDDQGGKDKRIKSLNEIACEFLQLTKSFKSAKEAQKA